MPATKYRHFAFTLNNYTDDDLTQLRELAPKVKYLVFGKETSNSGTPHLQGFVSFPNPRSVNRLHSLFHHPAHWEVARDARAAAEYCKKDGDYTEYGVPFAVSRAKQGKRSDIEAVRDAINGGESDRKKLRQDFPGVSARYPNFIDLLISDQIPEPEVEDHGWSEWQSKLVETLEGPPDKRIVVFIVDTEGGAGKTWFIEAYQKKYGNSINLKPGKKADMTLAFMSQLTKDTKVAFIDAQRSKQGEYVQYDFLEDLKDGSLLNSKYQSRMFKFKTPHVVVMMNEEPEADKLSADRYDIRYVNGT